MARFRSYTELIQIPTFEERYSYLELKGEVGRSTFGFDRWLNQEFYHSREWRMARDMVLVRDYGCDLAFPDYVIPEGALVHHMNPMSELDIISGESRILDPEYLITTSHRTHNAIHYGDASLLPSPPVERSVGDTKLW